MERLVALFLASLQRGRSLRRWGARLGKLMPCLLLLSTLCWWDDAETRLAKDDGKVMTLGTLSFDLPVGAPPTEIGYVRLMQHPGAESAEPNHILIEHVAGPDGQSRVVLRNFARQRHLLLRLSDGTSGDADRWALPVEPPGGNSTVAIGGTLLTFSQVSPSGFHIAIDTAKSGDKRREFAFSLDWSDDRLVEIDPAAPVPLGKCQSASTHWMRSFSAAARDLFRRLVSSTPRRVMNIGGDLVCRSDQAWQIAAPLLGWRAFSVSYNPTDRRFYLEADDPEYRSDRRTVFRQGSREILGFSGIDWPLEAGRSGQPYVTGFIAGRTSYQVTSRIEGVGATRHALIAIKPAEGGNTALFPEGATPCGAPEPNADCTRNVRPSPPFALLDRYVNGNTDALSPWERRIRWGLLAIAIGSAGLLSPASNSSLGSWFRRLRDDWPRTVPALAWGLAPMLLTVLSATLTLLPELAAASNYPFTADGARALMLCNWFAAGCVVIWAEAGALLGVFWLLVTIIAAIGSISLTSLALDGDSTYWVGFIAKHRLLFLDLMPPFIVAAASAPIAAIRQVLQELVIGNRNSLGYFALRWLPMAALFTAFLVWVAIGDAQGVGGFQPVEAGKFAALPLIAVPLVGFWRAARRLSTRPGRARQFISLLVIAALLAALLVFPVVRSDYSPALILGVLGIVLVAFHFLPDGIGATLRYLRVSIERARIPLRYAPPVRRPRERWRWLLVPIGIVGMLGGGVIGLLATPSLVAMLLQMDSASLSADRDQALDRLQDALGRSERFVPVERFITWYDLAYPAATATAANSVKFRDLDFQVIRSRVIVGAAACRSSTLFPESGAHWSAGRMIAGGFVAVVAATQVLLGPLVPHEELCQTPPPRDAGADGRAIAAGGPRHGRMLDDRAPNHIPVVQSDFAAAYLIGRHGIEAAALLFVAQALLLLLILRSWCRLWWSPVGESADHVVRHLVSIVLAGAGLLFALQWGIAWSNVLGLLPVMGQPMTFLAAGTSHHLGMALPCTLTILIAIRYSLQPVSSRPPRSPPPQP
jgi:hypothetical protein